MVKDPTMTQIQACAITGVIIAVSATCFRLYLRARRRNLWWDDAWAFMSMVAIIIMFTGMLIFTSPPDAHPRATKIAGYYMVDNGFYGCIWCARISILLTVIRMAFGRFRQILKGVVVAILITWSVLFAQVFWTCETEAKWKNEPNPQCMLGKEVAIAQLITDCICDLILIACPTYLLSSMKNRRGLKIRLIAIFSSTIFTTIFSLVHSYMILKGLGLMEFMFAVVEVRFFLYTSRFCVLILHPRIQDVVSLLVVNLTVIATWFFQLKDDGESEETGPSAFANTFLKGRLSGGRNTQAMRGGTTTIGLATFGGITRVEVNTERVVDKGDGNIAVLSSGDDTEANRNSSVEKLGY
ncbi:hypothetical protein VNI00_006906 [Paramarasmius palmivorus]|uniref:Rhodopsin domain-containing protein n=1 Tax=Paramarasmius palmivorus TaxID=297713 RepID=A0AAW0D843_9AGAR